MIFSPCQSVTIGCILTSNNNNNNNNKHYKIDNETSCSPMTLDKSREQPQNSGPINKKLGIGLVAQGGLRASKGLNRSLSWVVDRVPRTVRVAMAYYQRLCSTLRALCYSSCVAPRVFFFFPFLSHFFSLWFPRAIPEVVRRSEVL